MGHFLTTRPEVEEISTSSSSKSTKSSISNKALKFPPFLRGKRVLLATESFGPVNGVSRTTLNLVRYLRKNGVEVAVVAPRIGSSEAPSISPSEDAPTSEIELRLGGYPLPYDPSLTVVYPLRLSKIYKRTFRAPPDLIYLASPASLGFQVLFQLRQQPRENEVPVLLNFQTDLSGYCEILFPSALASWAVLVFGSVQGYLFRHESVRTVFYPSLFVRRYLHQVGVQPKKMMNIRRGVDRDIFHPSKRSEDIRKELAPGDQLLMICVARLAPEKGFGFLAEVVKELEAREFSFHLRIVGGNQNAQVEQTIFDMFSTLRDAGKVSFAGFLEGEVLAQAYASADVFLHSSITETFGLVVLEAMASGVPVIARDEGGPSDIVLHDETGYLVAPGDLNGFVERVVGLGNDIILRTRMSNEARLRTEETTWDGIGNQVAWEMDGVLKKTMGSKAAIVSVPWYSWRYPGKVLRRVVAKFRSEGSRVVICGVWAGLIVTYILVEATPVFTGAVGYVPGARFLTKKCRSWGVCASSWLQLKQD